MAAQTEKSPAKGGGRPRSDATRRSILSATFLLLEKESVHTITVEAIARQAGVGKATIYRWWKSKASVVIDAFIEHHIDKAPMRYDLHPAEALLRHWRLTAEEYRRPAGRIITQILAEGQSDPSILHEFTTRFYPRTVFREIVEKLQMLHQMPAGVDSECFMGLLYGSLFMRIFWQNLPIDDDFIKSYPLTVFRLVGIEFDESGRLL